MDFYTSLIVAILALFFAGFFAGIEIAFVSSNRVRVGLDTQKKDITSRIISFFYGHQDMFLSTMMVGNCLMLVVYGIAVQAVLSPYLEMATDNTTLLIVLKIVVATGLIIVTGEFLPKAVFRINPNDSLRHLALPAFVVYLLLYPVSLTALFLSRLLMRLVGGKTDTDTKTGITVVDLDEYIQQAIDEKKSEAMAADNGIDHEMKIFQNALDFSTTLLRDCMIPRNEIIGVDIKKTDATRLRQRFIATGLSKIIVYTGDIDNVNGYIHVSELFNEKSDWTKQIRQVIYAPESMLAKVMMRKMLAEKKSMAIIVDEFGGTSGLVTLEDLVEEIFGDFEDEHDRKKMVEEQLDDGSFRFSGRIEIEKINEKYNFNLPENDEYQTLAGYILYNISELPKQGGSFVIGDLQFTILKQSGNKIDLVGVKQK